MKLIYIIVSIIINTYTLLSACPTCVSNSHPEPFFSDEYYAPYEQQQSSVETKKLTQSKGISTNNQSPQKPCCQNKKKESSHE